MRVCSQSHARNVRLQAPRLLKKHSDGDQWQVRLDGVNEAFAVKGDAPNDFMLLPWRDSPWPLALTVLMCETPLLCPHKSLLLIVDLCFVIRDCGKWQLRIGKGREGDRILS